MFVSPMCASMIRGCHPTYSHDPCNEDWCLISILDYYRMIGTHPYPHPCKYWRFVFELKWGWKYSITDFKTHSIKEYIFMCKLKEDLQNEITFRTCGLYGAFSRYTNRPGCLPQIIMTYLYAPNIKEELQHQLHKHAPIRLPATHPVNPLQVFFGRCYQHGLFHPNTRGCFIPGGKWVQLDVLVYNCKTVPRPCIRCGNLLIQNRDGLLKLLYNILIEDKKNYEWPHLSLFFEEMGCNSSSGMIDAWINDLFGW